jgi:hypothetical protein
MIFNLRLKRAQKDVSYVIAAQMPASRPFFVMMAQHEIHHSLGAEE